MVQAWTRNLVVEEDISMTLKMETQLIMNTLEDGYERLGIGDFGESKHDELQLMDLLYTIAEDRAGKVLVEQQKLYI
ncbi:hypothetical protein BGX26_011018 [Mortierella sp. AD094]|nr:hypothetical protein BGX26_011018 [Mortierella sp. AD094]